MGTIFNSVHQRSTVDLYDWILKDKVIALDFRLWNLTHSLIIGSTNPPSKNAFKANWEIIRTKRGEIRHDSHGGQDLEKIQMLYADDPVKVQQQFFLSRMVPII